MNFESHVSRMDENKLKKLRTIGCKLEKEQLGNLSQLNFVISLIFAQQSA